MITFDEAYKKVMENLLDLGNETVTLMKGMKRILAEDILADRDFPPFDRSTKDGIVLNYSAIEKGVGKLKIEGVLSAGMPQQTLSASDNCFEIMTGAVVPRNADTVIMYEEVIIENGFATISTEPRQAQNVHAKGNDERVGAVLLKKGTAISAAEMGVLATVGKTEVWVKKVPKVSIISTGNELVDVSQTPLPHQIRKSNAISLFAALSKENIAPGLLHLMDDKKRIREYLLKALRANEVLLLSGGVSKGKFDFIPEVMQELGVQRIFHRVAQRPGKPFWFGVHKELKTVVFSFPGNPVSTFANYHVYFVPWLYRTLGVAYPKINVILDETFHNELPLTRFVQVKTRSKEGCLYAKPIKEGGSGDLNSLTKSDGFICLRPSETPYEKGGAVPFIPTR